MPADAVRCGHWSQARAQTSNLRASSAHVTAVATLSLVELEQNHAMCTGLGTLGFSISPLNLLSTVGGQDESSQFSSPSPET